MSGFVGKVQIKKSSLVQAFEDIFLKKKMFVLRPREAFNLCKYYWLKRKTKEETQLKSGNIVNKNIKNEMIKTTKIISRAHQSLKTSHPV